MMMSFSDTQIDQLSAKLDGSYVKKNPKGFDYVEGWRAIAEANRIFGFDGWAREIVNLKSLHDPYQNNKENWVISYGCTVRITVTAGDKKIVRDGCGYGSGFSKIVGDAHESAIKEAETDAMKRALMTFGNPFGLALYDKEQANVEYGQHRQQQPDRSDDQYVADASAWLKNQTDIHVVNEAWSAEQEHYHRLPLPLQKKLLGVRDEVLAKLAPKSGPASDWELIAANMKRDIDNALDTVAIRDVLESPDFAGLEAHSKTAAAFLRDRAQKRAGVIAQGGRRAA